LDVVVTLGWGASPSQPFDDREKAAPQLLANLRACLL
jgi:hypothetical protein